MQESPEESSIARGRVYVAIAIAVTLIGDASFIALKMSSKGVDSSISGVVRWFITLALLLAVWRGRSWARWLTVALKGIALILSVPMLVSTWHPIIVAVFSQILLCFVLLTCPPSTSRFLAAQRLKSS